MVFLDSVTAPLYSVAGLGLIGLDGLPETKAAELPIWGTGYQVEFLLEDDCVRVSERYYGTTSAIIEYDQLRLVWRDFAECVRQFVVTEFPPVRERDDSIGEWFRKVKT